MSPPVHARHCPSGPLRVAGMVLLLAVGMVAQAANQAAKPGSQAGAAQTIAQTFALAGAPSAAPAEAGSTGRCIDEDKVDVRADSAVATAAQPVPQPRAQLQAMVAEALSRSQSLGAARLLAEAAMQDTEEAKAARHMQASFNGSVGPAYTQSLGVSATNALQLSGGINISQLIYDGGRNDRLVDWRSQLAEAARYGHLSLQEQLALNTVSLALERSRYRLHALVFGQYVRKMGCLVDALQQIVNADKGRMSELVQAQKSLQQAELSQVQAVTQARQVEIRLRRLVGDGLPAVEGLSTVLLAVPELPSVVADASRASEIAQLDAQAAAMSEYARSLEASTKPQVSWLVGGNKAVGIGGSAGNGRNGALSAGIAIQIPLLNPGIDSSVDAARKRAQASAMQRADALESRIARITETYEQATAAFDRARRVGTVLRDSDKVRNYTLQQWQQLGRRSLFDVMAAEGDHYNLRVAYVDALHDGQQTNAILLSLGRGVTEWLK